MCWQGTTTTEGKAKRSDFRILLSTREEGVKQSIGRIILHSNEKR